MRIKNTTYRLELRTGGKWLERVAAPSRRSLGICEAKCRIRPEHHSDRRFQIAGKRS